MTHQHGFAMCVHDRYTEEPCDIDSKNATWHQACAAPGCPTDHWAWGALEAIVCAYCGSPDHAPIDCPKPRANAFGTLDNDF